MKKAKKATKVPQKAAKTPKKAKKTALVGSIKESALDKVLSKFGPNLQGRMQQLSLALDSQKNKLIDLRYFGLKVLEKTMAVRDSLPKASRSKTVAQKKVKKPMQKAIQKPGQKLSKKLSKKLARKPKGRHS